MANSNRPKCAYPLSKERGRTDYQSSPVRGGKSDYERPAPVPSKTSSDPHAKGGQVKS